MPRSDLFPPDIMDKHAAFAGAINDYLRLVQNWETRAFDPNQPRIPAGEPGAGQWLNENDEAPGATEAPAEPTPAPTQTSPAMAMDAPPRFQVALRPPEIQNPGDPLLDEAAKTPTAPQFYRQIRTTPTYVAMYNAPNFVDPTLGFPRSPEKSFIGPPDMTRPDVPYVEASRFDTFKDLFLPALPNYQFHHVVEQTQWPFFTDRPNDPRSVHNSSNIVILREDIHTCVSAEFSTNVAPGMTLRESLKGEPYAKQYQTGLEMIEKCQNKKKEENVFEYAPQTQMEPDTTTFPPTVFPPIPPRLPGKQNQYKNLDNPENINLMKGYNGMNISEKNFNLEYLMSLLSTIDDMSSVMSVERVERTNPILDEAWNYFRKFEPTPALWAKVTPLLENPRKLIRVWIAVEMLRAGNKDGWQTLIAELSPNVHRAPVSKEQINRDFSAESLGMRFLNFNHKLLEAIGVTPSLSEVEDRWIEQGMLKRRLVRLS